MELLVMLGLSLAAGTFAVLDSDDDSEPAADTSADATKGNDDLSGASKDDTIFANEGHDILAGNGGDDRLFGQGGQDLLVGGEGDDFLRGGSDHDTIIDGKGSDTLIGDAGNDFIVSTSAFDPDNVLEAGREWVANDDPDVRIILEYDVSQDIDEAPDVIRAGFGDDNVVAGRGDTVTLGEGYDDLALGDWIEAGDDPVVVTDYDRDHDMIVYYHDGVGPAPEITVESEQDETSDAQDALLLANGEVFARLQGAGGLVSENSVQVRIIE
ncbi:calcium-binding protein [Leisingera sp. M523]|uniref:calcium-binding protein n=1 Tax=Leisingera sp. M523 TaxID=2867013 RepID=UPI0021A946FA|nr:hypothetical protein [Leisingera sp. M523]UWQ30493.1 hypothetical protein K3557_08185 [Leisingera sp. M523]